jgi:RNA polymerase sigma factor (sigma-70 family)
MFPEAGNFGVYLSPSYRFDLPGNPVAFSMPKKSLVILALAASLNFSYSFMGVAHSTYRSNGKYVHCSTPITADNLPELSPHTKNFSRLPDEARLIQLASEGDQQAYGCLYSYYYPQLYTSLAFISQSHEDAQEVIHEAFLKIWKTKETLVLVRSFEDYVYTFAKNLLFNQLKRKKVNEKVIQFLSDHTAGNAGSSPDQQLLFKQYYQAALVAIDQLPAQKRKIFLLRTQEGLTLDEIATAMGISRSAVKKHLYAAIDSVKEYLRQHTGDVLLLVIFYFF